METSSQRKGEEKKKQCHAHPDTTLKYKSRLHCPPHDMNKWGREKPKYYIKYGPSIYD